MSVMRYISLGLGVQSTTLLHMADRGDVGPTPDVAIFSDPGWESRLTYEHLDYVRSVVRNIPIVVVSAGNIRDDLVARNSARSGRFVTVPFFLKQTKANGGIKEGMGRRQCTTHYKIEPIQKKIREILGKGPRQRIAPNSVEAWVGISLDEVIRATPSKVKYIVKRFPLLDRRMRRSDCVRWLEERQIKVPPKSACIGCPFHGNDQWRDMRDNRPDEWADAVAVDSSIRGYVTDKTLARMKAEQFMHRQLVPLDQADISSEEERGQMSLFDHECEGMCGV